MIELAMCSRFCVIYNIDIYNDWVEFCFMIFRVKNIGIGIYISNVFFIGNGK